MINTRSLTQEERFELVMECRSSGLSDYQWCQEKGIHPGTFYNWIARFRKKGYPNIPEPTGRTSKHKAVKQEVVRYNCLSIRQIYFRHRTYRNFNHRNPYRKQCHPHDQ